VRGGQEDDDDDDDDDDDYDVDESDVEVSKVDGPLNHGGEVPQITVIDILAHSHAQVLQLSKSHLPVNCPLSQGHVNPPSQARPASTAGSPSNLKDAAGLPESGSMAISSISAASTPRRLRRGPTTGAWPQVKGIFAHVLSGPPTCASRRAFKHGKLERLNFPDEAHADQ
jgi:hypothetical protein